ncbi:hypothetical protein LINPERHAP1_LOCUS22402 [Linum perenne]
MLEGARSAIRDGHGTLFWTNVWVDVGLSLIDFADTTKSGFDIRCSVAEMTTDEGCWSFQLLETMLQPDILDVIARMSPSQVDKDGDETSAHVLRECSFARETWQLNADLANDSEWQLPFSDFLQHYLKSGIGLQFGVVCWYLWKSRNQRVFANIKEIPSLVAHKCAQWTATVKRAMCRESVVLDENGSTRMVDVAWQAGPCDWITLNSDGSVLGPRGNVAVGRLLREF